MMASAPADDVQGPGGKKVTAAAGDAGAAMRPPEQGLKCPRCDSPNTKFCYYNNYSLAQPRYFCKTCRRYWTKGGALRNVPVGGGCRKSKKSKSSSISSTTTSSFSSVSSRHASDPKDGGADHELRFYHGLPSTVDFHLTGGLPFSRLHHPTVGPGVFDATATEGSASANHFISFGDLSCSSATLPTEATGATAASLIGFSYPIQAVAAPFADMGMGGGDATTSGTTLASMHGNLAASIESLSSINQGLHWKLQQQRLAMFFGGDQSQHHHSKGAGGDAANTAAAAGGGHRPALVDGPHRPMPCQVPASAKEVSVAGGGASSKGSTVADANSSSTEWFLENSGAYSTPNARGSSVDNGGIVTGTANNNWNGIQTWGDMHQFSALP